MSWRNLTIGKKITIGFGIVILLLVILGALSFSGVGGIVKNASEVIDGKALDGALAQKEVDHLNWIGHVNKLLTDANVNTLNVQTDHTKCGFGKWLYGEDRQKAQALVPTLSPLLKEIETPHKLLHESAIEIAQVYAAADPKLPGFIASKLNDHLEWAGSIQTAMLENAETIRVQTDHTLCGFGKWLYSNEASQVAASNPELGAFIDQIKRPHEKLHESAKQIISTYDQIHPGLQNVLRKRLDDHRRWTAAVSNGIIQNSSFNVETDPAKCGFGKWLLSDEVSELMKKDGTLSKILNKVKEPHQKLHQTAVRINSAIKQGRIEQAKTIFNTQTLEYLSTVSALFEKAIQYEEALVQNQEQAVQIFKETSLVELGKTKEILHLIQQRAQGLLAGQYKAADIYASKTAPSLEKVQGLLGKLRQEVKKNMLTDKAMLKAATGTKRNVAIIAAIAIAAGVFLAFFIAKGIIVVLQKITIGMGEGANQVASAAGQVSSSSQSMAEGSSEQAASIEETSASMEEMSSMTKKNAENANHADGLMKEANQIVSTANDSMDHLTKSMEEISKASEETSKIIKTIDEIAFQTNLLALNAAVEAARAGEAGAGFAVVADEVRNLAMRAAEAAKDTAQLIEGTVKKVEDGSDLVSKTNEAFDHVAESAAKVGDLIEEISAASNEQSEGISQVNTAITEMDKVVQQNAANAEESASAAEEMNAQAEQLREYVGDLMRMVNGNKDRSNGHKMMKLSYSSDAPEKLDNQKKLAHPSKEIRPEQVIPFDDDEAFKDF